MAIRVYNTLTRQKEPFEPLNPPRVGIYLCGPTVYKPSHIGHAVGPIIFDCVKRYLQFRGYDVTLVINVTDVDDKLIIEADAQNTTVPELAERILGSYLDAMNQLGIDSIDLMPKASEHIGDICDNIQKLIDNDVAYVSGQDVYFDVTRDDDYGKLSSRKVEDQTEHRDVVGETKRNPSDFALWKAAKPDEPDSVIYDSPWGRGRPGWHIECSAMSTRYLGDTFDIHGGGMDLIFPHHENEIAQAESATNKTFVKYWLHHGLTRFNTKKISKSDADMQEALKKMTLSHLLTEFTGEQLRYFVISTHYRRPIEFSDAELDAKKKGLATFHRLFERIERVTQTDLFSQPADSEDEWKSAEKCDADFAGEVDAFAMRFVEMMDDDFNTAGAIATLFDFANRANRFIEENKLETEDNVRARETAIAATRELMRMGQLLGLFRKRAEVSAVGDDELVGKLMGILIDARAQSRKAKQFDIADSIRDQLTDAGVALEDRPDGTLWRIE